jgi:hypothetical protein
MWEWLLREVQKSVKALRVNKALTNADEDEIISAVCYYLCSNQDVAKEIYEGHKIGLLYKLAREEIYEAKSKIYFDNKMDLSRYQRIKAVCEQYGIEPKPENAYKISVLMDNGSANITVPKIIALLSPNNPANRGYHEERRNNM